MARRPRVAPGGFVYHVLNRAAHRHTLFDTSRSYAAFERALREAKERTPLRLLAYCVMPNHWHLVVWPQPEAELSQFMHWLTGTHAQRWQKLHGTVGTGPVYQDRFKAIPVQADVHLFRVCRYVERNPVRANLVTRAEEWRWSSLWRRCRKRTAPMLDEWPISIPVDWIDYVNSVQTLAELEALRGAVVRGAPFGSEQWRFTAARELGLESSLRGRGRPRKEKDPRPLFTLFTRN